MVVPLSEVDVWTKVSSVSQANSPVSRRRSIPKRLRNPREGMLVPCPFYEPSFGRVEVGHPFRWPPERRGSSNETTSLCYKSCQAPERFSGLGYAISILPSGAGVPETKKTPRGRIRMKLRVLNLHMSIRRGEVWLVVAQRRGQYEEPSSVAQVEPMWKRCDCAVFVNDVTFRQSVGIYLLYTLQCVQHVVA
ncbi:hypothetical protein BDN72DRAFT_833411 [Pluteus cervinus]|uniref:Uncharacterized protein n=1 Tax=Pluteus cervinus TaxID=181527 RepID=A0ACD3BBV7_9AGAR|nr:hypothetical protein BDN72DRAFT_833411 [Pluteus cervinus]